MPASSTADVDPFARAVEAEQEGRLLDALDQFRALYRHDADPALEARILGLRHTAFQEVDRTAGRSSWPPVFADLTPVEDGPPAVTLDELTVDVLGSAIVNHGALLIRGLIPDDGVAALTDSIDRAFAGRDEWETDPSVDGAPWFVPFEPSPAYLPANLSREWVRKGGGVWAADSPRVMAQLLETYDANGLGAVIGGYLGERPAVSMRKCTLRRCPASLEHADWHQDGAFLGDDVRSVNVWLTLTDCGGDTDSPGLDYVPRRVDHLVDTGVDGALFNWSVGPGTVDRVVDDLSAPVIRPTFRAGDALLFDDLFLHRTATEPGLTRDRYAIESWFFAPSRYPDDQIPLVF